jgi:hypothetical protein
VTNSSIFTAPAVLTTLGTLPQTNNPASVPAPGGVLAPVSVLGITAAAADTSLRGAVVGPVPGAPAPAAPISTPTTSQARVSRMLADFLVPRTFPQLPPASDALGIVGPTVAGLQMTGSGFFAAVGSKLPAPGGHRLLPGRDVWGNLPGLHAAPFIALAVVAALATVFVFRWLLNMSAAAGSGSTPWGAPASAKTNVMSQVRSRIARQP